MKLEPIKLFRNKKAGVDELGNAIYEKELFTSGTGQITPWTREDIALLPREITKTEEKLITQMSFEECSKASILVINDKEFSIEEVTNYIRWCVLRVKRYGD